MVKVGDVSNRWRLVVCIAALSVACSDDGNAGFAGGAGSGGSQSAVAGSAGYPVSGSGGGTVSGSGGEPVSGAGTGGLAGGTGGLPAGTGGSLAGTGGSLAGTGGSLAGTGGAAAGTGGAVATGCEATDPFSGPPLRDCNLPGACGRCLWEKSCAAFDFQCARNADCVCMAECIGNFGVSGVQSCLGQCGLTALPPGFAEFANGAADMCWDEGCGTLAEPLQDPPGSGASIGAGTDESCFFDTNLRYDPCGQVLQLQSSDGSICLRLERRNDGAGNDANTTWTLLDVRVGPLGEVCHTDDPAALCWFSSHHNYADWAHATCGDRHYDLNVAKNCGVHNSHPSPTFRLHVFEIAPPGGECAPATAGLCPIGSPIDLFPVP
jgi:hypothetical protein